MYAYKVMLCPNNKQRTKIRETLNKCIECNNIIYDYLDGFIKRKEKFPSCKEVRKWFTVQKTILDDMTISKREGLTNKEIRERHLNTLFYDVSNDALKQEIKDTYNAFKRFFDKLSKYPNKKSYKSYKKSFYVDPFKIEITNNKVKLEKITSSTKKNRRVINYINLAEKGRIPQDVKYYNPRVILEGDRLYITIAVDSIPKTVELTEDVIGIDLNISEIVTSDNDRFQTITKDKRYIKTKKRLRRSQRKLSRKYINNTENNRKLRTCKNYQKQKKTTRKLLARLNNLKSVHDENIVTRLVQKLPKTIQIEDLAIKAMKEDKETSKYIRRGIQQNGWGIIVKKLQNKCGKYNIEVKKINRWFPSSKTCSKCGNVKKDLQLSERTYICSKCGLKIDRDLNAAINIRNYK